METYAGNDSRAGPAILGIDQSDAERFRRTIGSAAIFRSRGGSKLAGALRGREPGQMPVSPLNRLEPQTGTAFELRAGQQLRVIDLEGEQVADLTAFNAADKSEWLSSGRSIDYANRIYVTTHDILYSN